ncbi:MAG TPA: hypothetical protein VJ767_00605 [Nitrososphaeraceae archaeon]|nr:hypothetical protein [Nitrososphaeraceae archaeon]
MNITGTEISQVLIAKICGCKESNKKIIYSFVDQYHSLCLDKRDILASQIEACENLLIATPHNEDKQIIENEISELNTYL